MNKEPQKFLSVSELTLQIKSTLTSHFPSVCVEGEIGNLTNHQSGHSYFTLKDENASIKCVAFKGMKSKLKIELEEGLKVCIIGNLSLYEQRGEYQIIAQNITKSGIGNLAQKFEELKNKLRERGYFENTRKKQIPKFPKKVAILTSQSGAVIHDMQEVAKKRWNLTQLTLINTAVQGNEAKNDIASNLKYADSLGFDIIILARGGGSLEDLWSFNEECVADAIYNAKTPIVSAIGHEVDYTLSDFVADLRAPTPSACMEMILPDKNEWLLKIDDIAQSLTNTQKNNLQKKQNTLNDTTERLKSFRLDFNAMSEDLRELGKMLDSLFLSLFSHKTQSLENLEYLFKQSAKSRITGKIQDSANLFENLTNALNSKLTIKQNSLIDENLLHRTIANKLDSKLLELKNTQELLESHNPSKNLRESFVQITIDNKVVNLATLKSGDKITLSDGVESKDAIII